MGNFGKRAGTIPRASNDAAFKLRVADSQPCACIVHTGFAANTRRLSWVCLPLLCGLCFFFFPRGNTMLTRAVSRAMSSSSSGPLFLGLDASTQGLKATLVDSSLRPVPLKGGGEAACARGGVAVLAQRARRSARRPCCAPVTPRLSLPRRSVGQLPG